jgi:hypothetical protein
MMDVGEAVSAGESELELELEEAPAEEADAASDCTWAFLLLSPPEKEPPEASESTAAGLLVGRKTSLEGDCCTNAGVRNAVHVVVVGGSRNDIASKKEHSIYQARTRGGS